MRNSRAKWQEKTYRCHKRATNEGDHRPVKRENTHSKTRVSAEQGIDGEIVGGNPADPVEDTKGSEQIPWNPIPDEAACHDDTEETFTGHVAPVALAKVFVECVEKRRVNQGTRPNHTRRPNNKLSQHTAKRKAQDLGAESDEKLVGVGQLLVVEELLRGDNFSSICTTDTDIGHNGYANVLLDTEGAGVQGPSVTEGPEPSLGENFLQPFPERQTDKLDDYTGNEKTRI